LRNLFEFAWEDPSQTFIEVPNELVPAVREFGDLRTGIDMLIKDRISIPGPNHSTQKKEKQHYKKKELTK